MSKLKHILGRVFGNTPENIRSIVVKTDPSEQIYHYDRPEKVDYDFVRKLYRNRNNQYVFGGQLVKPVIDSNVSFIGIPEIRTEDEKTSEKIKELLKEIPFTQIHRIAEREGTCFVWPQITEEGKLKVVVMPTENIKDTFINPITKDITGYQIVEKFTYKEPNSTSPYNVTIELFVYKDKVERKISGDNAKINGTKTIRNPFGFIPIVIFKNDHEPWETMGHSEIENIEPQIKLYHDITLEAMQAQKRDGHPKAKIKTPNPKQWVDTNYGTGTFDRLAGGEGYISLKDRDLFVCRTGSLNESDEDVQYIEANKATGDYAVISERTFTNIVEGSQTPEIVFGANMGTSLASVREQRPVYIKKIEKKQLQYERYWRELFSVIFGIVGFATFDTFPGELEFIWPIPDFSSDKEKADTFNVMTNALIKMKSSYLMSDEEIHETIKKFEIVNVKQNYDKHYEEIEKTAEDIAKRMEDELAAQNLEMNQRVATGEYDNEEE